MNPRWRARLCAWCAFACVARGACRLDIFFLTTALATFGPPLARDANLMGARRKPRKPMALAMHLCPSEVAAYDASLALVDENGTDGMQAEATFVRQQLSLHASYVRVCVRGAWCVST